MADQKTAKSPMSSEHKEALAVGREQSRIVRQYLEALETNRPRRGRKRTPESIQKRLATIETELGNVDALRRLQLLQERIDLNRELSVADTPVDVESLEADFAKVAADYATRKGISYAAWREMGVDPAVLKKAGISRTS